MISSTFRLITSDSVNPVAVRVRAAVASASGVPDATTASGVPDATAVATAAPEATATATATATTTATVAVDNSVGVLALIDNSGSMDSDNRMSNVKRSLHCLVDTLKPTDAFSLVTFSSTAHILFRQVPMTDENKVLVRQQISGIHATTCTNLELGLRSIEEVLETPSKTQSQSILLLTDGEANEGRNSIPDLTGIVRRIITANPRLTLDTVGYGLQHNAELLAAMAREGGGGYNIVTSLDHVATVFGDVLGGLRTTLYQQVKLFLPPTVRQISKYALFTPPATAAATSTTVPKNEIFAGDLRESGEILFLLDYVDIDADGITPLDLRSIDATTGVAIRITNLVLSPPSAEDIAAGLIAYLRYKVVDFLQAPHTARDALAVQGRALIAEVAALQATQTAPQTLAILAMLHRELTQTVTQLEAPPPPPSALNLTRMTSQQHSAYIGTGRGMYSTPSQPGADADEDPMTSVFSNTSQRAASNVMRSASSAADPADTSYVSAPPRRAVTGGSGLRSYGGGSGRAGSLAPDAIGVEDNEEDEEGDAVVAAAVAAVLAPPPPPFLPPPSIQRVGSLAPAPAVARATATGVATPHVTFSLPLPPPSSAPVAREETRTTTSD